MLVSFQYLTHYSIRSWLSASVLRIRPRWLSLPMSGKLTQRESFFTVCFVSSFLVFLMTSTWWLPSSGAAENESECVLIFYLSNEAAFRSVFSVLLSSHINVFFQTQKQETSATVTLGIEEKYQPQPQPFAGSFPAWLQQWLFLFLSCPPHPGLPWAVFLSCSTREMGWAQGSEPGRRTSLRPVLTLSSYWRNTATERWGSTVSVTERIEWFPEGCEIKLRTWLREWERKQYTFNDNEPFIGFKDFLSFCLMAFCLTWTCLRKTFDWFRVGLTYRLLKAS